MFHALKIILDKDIIQEECAKSKLIVSVEEHNIIGGLGSAISELKSQIQNSPKLLRIGVDDYYSKGGSYKFLLNKHGLTPEAISNNILKNLK